MEQMEEWIPRAMEAGVKGVMVWFFIGMPYHRAALEYHIEPVSFTAADRALRTAVKRAIRFRQEMQAPHLVDVEVYGVIRDKHRAGGLDRTAAAQAVEDLSDWPGERFAHRMFLSRAWELRDNMRGWDAMYVALAEALDAVLLTTDGRLTRAAGPRCRMEWFAPSAA